MSCKNYVSCTTLDDWFAGYDQNKTDWILPEIINSLKDALAESHILMIDALDDDIERFKNISDAIVSALRDLRSLEKEVTQAIAVGDILVQKGKKGGKDEDD